MAYVDIASYSATTEYGQCSVKISIDMNRRHTSEDAGFCAEKAGQVFQGIMEQTVKLTPSEMVKAAEEKRDILSLFPDPIYAEEIPNGYCSRWCCKHRPWFIVTTRKGRITIGWRKRVIQIRWEKLVNEKSADDLFPDQEVTKDGRMIHAWSYEYAKRYIETILA